MASFGTRNQYSPAWDRPPEARPPAGVGAADALAGGLGSAATFGSAAELLEDGLARRTSQGLTLEFGVYQGRTINFIAERSPEQTVFGFDTFTGLPEDWRPGFEKGTFATAIPEVRPNVHLVVGLFEHTLPAFLATHAGPMSFIHVDCDLYSSTRTVLRHCRDRIGPGTMIVFDEYTNYPGWQDHEHRAFREFIAETGRSFEYVSWVPSNEQVGVLITG
jgi:hypothetical protein